jgi:hypothetical protein
MRITSNLLYEQVETLNKSLTKDSKLVLRSQNGVWALFTKIENGGLYNVTAFVTLNQVSYFLDGVQWTLNQRKKGVIR